MKKIQLNAIEKKMHRIKDRKLSEHTGKLIEMNIISEDGLVFKKDKKKKTRRCQNWDDISVRRERNKPLIVKYKKNHIE